MNRIIVIAGPVSSGKSTLARTLSKHYNIPWHSSDDIREELSGDIGGDSEGTSKFTGKYFNVFKTFKERVDRDIQVGSVIADSTGMSKNFRNFIKEWKSKYPTFVIKLTIDKETWTKRELIRTDRVTIPKGSKSLHLEPFEMPQRAYDGSLKALKEFDYEIDTSTLTPDEVFTLAVLAIEHLKC